jgi:hypothetical protein
VSSLRGSYKMHSSKRLGFQYFRHCLWILHITSAAIVLSRLSLSYRRRKAVVSPQDPFHRLSSELLALIFEATVEEGVCYDARTVINLSHVSRRWRRVATTTPEIWTCIDLRHGAAETFLMRSKALPICITHVISSARGFCLTKMLVQKPPEQVYSLSLSSTSDIVYALPFEVTHGLVNLRQLHLRGFSTKYWGWLGKLTHLTLGNLTRPYCPRADTIVYILDRNPLLRKIHLYHLDPEVPEVSAGRRTVHLNHVEVFVIDFPTAAVGYLLSHVSIPASAPLFASPYRWLNQLGHSRSLRIDAGGIALDVGRFFGDPWLDICDPSIFSEPSFSFIRNIVSAIDMSSITSLSISDMDSWVLDSTTALNPSVELWTELLSNMPSVTSIWLPARKAEFVAQFLRALWPRENAQEEACPHLNTLRIELLDSHANDLQSLGSVLLEQLLLRSKITEAPLESLMINFGDDETIERLRGMVKVLIVGVSVRNRLAREKLLTHTA